MYPILITLAIVGLYSFAVVKLLRKRHPLFMVVAFMPVPPGALLLAFTLHIVFFHEDVLTVTKEPIPVSTAPRLIPLPKRFKYTRDDLQVCLKTSDALGRRYAQFDPGTDHELRKLFQVRVRTINGEFQPLDGAWGYPDEGNSWLCRTEMGVQPGRGSTYDAIEVTGSKEFSIQRMKIVSSNRK